MSQYNFFKPCPTVGKFQAKLESAIALIKQNQSLIAMKVIEVLEQKAVTIGSFYDLSPKHYTSMCHSLRKDNQINLPKTYPPTTAAVEKIESVLEGVIYEDQYIYLSSKKSIEQIASTLIHEVGHFLNSTLYNEESQYKSAKLVGYSDEVRSFTAEKMFEKNGHCITRSDMKKIHTTVTKLYPEFTGPEVNPQSLGYIYASYDWPLHEQFSATNHN